MKREKLANDRSRGNNCRRRGRSVDGADGRGDRPHYGRRGGEEGHVARLLTALHRKGETVTEVAGAAAAMRQRMTPIRSARPDLIDTCGTGGDGSKTFNISTAAALVTAAAGVPVAKHGNRGITSRSGSADVLAALGVNIDADAACVESCLDELGICFCFAPLLHSAMKHVAAVRKRLGTPTIFNILGPLVNPASAPFQLLGVGRAELQPLLAEALLRLGVAAGAGGAWIGRFGRSHPGRADRRDRGPRRPVAEIRVDARRLRPGSGRPEDDASQRPRRKRRGDPRSAGRAAAARRATSSWPTPQPRSGPSAAWRHCRSASGRRPKRSTAARPAMCSPGWSNGHWRPGGNHARLKHMPSAIAVNRNLIAEFCRKHGIRRLSLFGSVLREDFRPDSDVDVLVEFEPGHVPGFIHLYSIEEELSMLLGGRKVDL